MDNVIVQIKNGPMDFQIREPVSPLFGAMEKTNVAVELQLHRSILASKGICVTWAICGKRYWILILMQRAGFTGKQGCQRFTLWDEIWSHCRRFEYWIKKMLDRASAGSG